VSSIHKIASQSHTFENVATSLTETEVNPASEAREEVEALCQRASVFGRHLSSGLTGKIFKALHDLCG